MTITRVIDKWDESVPEVANVEELADVLNDVTADQQRWEQDSFCAVPQGVDELTEADLAAGVYHDFALTPDVVEAIRARHTRYHLPIANCGTALCVAGHVAIRNGWTFIAQVGEDSASRVIPTANVDVLLKEGRWGHDEELGVQESEEVARQALNLNYNDASVLFSGGNNLLDLWSIGYAITGGRLPLPDSLPASTRSWMDQPVTPELPTAEDVRDAVHLNLAIVTYFRHLRRYVKFIDLERVLPLLADTDEAAARRAVLLPAGRKDIERTGLEWTIDFLEAYRTEPTPAS